MDFKIKKATPEKTKTDALVLPVFEGNVLGSCCDQFSDATKKALNAVMANGDIKGKPGDSLVLTAVADSVAKRIILIGLGKAGEQTESAVRKAFSAAANAVNGTSAKDAVLTLDDIQLENRDTQWLTRQAVELFAYANYTFNAFKA